LDTAGLNEGNNTTMVFQNCQFFCWIPGFEGEDGKDCSDVDECAEEDKGGCSHICENTVGSFFCLCPEGNSFVLLLSLSRLKTNKIRVNELQNRQLAC
jgi:hypothetical protein